MFEDPVEMNDFPGNFKLPLLSEEEIENQNQGIIKRELRTLPKKWFSSQDPSLIGFMGEITLNFRGMKDFCSF